MVDSLSFMEVKMTTNQSLGTSYWGLLICAIQVCAQTGTDPSQFFKRRWVKPMYQETKGLVYFVPWRS